MLDLDGVIWLGDQPIPGSAEACARLRAASIEPVFVTNMSRLTVADQEAKLARHGIDAAGRVVTSSMAAARCCLPGERALVVGGEGIVEALTAREVEIVGRDKAAAAVGLGETAADAAGVDVVVVGLDPAFDYEILRAAALTIRAGARFVATNTDATYPTDRGLWPGAGAVVAAIAVASGFEPVVAGKPHAPVAELIHDLVGASGIVVGDRADTDGAFASSLGFGFGLVLSGATTAADLPVEPEPVAVAADLAEMVTRFLGS